MTPEFNQPIAIWVSTEDGCTCENSGLLQGAQAGSRANIPQFDTAVNAARQTYFTSEIESCSRHFTTVTREHVNAPTLTETHRVEDQTTAYNNTDCVPDSARNLLSSLHIPDARRLIERSR